MIENLLISASGPLAETKLLRLGRINVVCGKNNSGKSTLLMAAGQRDRATIGQPLGENEAQRIFDASHQQMAWHRDYPILDLEYQGVLEEVCQIKELWWATDHVDFYETLSAHMARSGLLSPYGRPSGPLIVSAYHSVFPAFPTAVVIPPKRYLELVESVNSTQTLTPGGQGILNRLFYLKNQFAGTPDHELFLRIRQAFEDISSGFSFDTLLRQGNDVVLNFSTPSGAWVPADRAGLGLQDLVILLYMALAPEFEFLLIEEPESHLHPELQRKLLNFFRNSTNKQYLLTTHSNVFLDVTLIDRVYYTAFRGHITADDATTRATILNDLGYEITDNLVSDLVVLVEGPSDSAFLQTMLAKTTFAPNRVIKFWPLGGDNMEHLDLTVFHERNRLIALIDRDPGSDAVRKRFIDKCEQLNIPLHRLERYSIESYFSMKALRAFYKGQISADLIELPHDQPAEDALGVGLKKNSRKIAELMTLDELAGTDLMEFIRKVEEISAPHRE